MSSASNVSSTNDVPPQSSKTVRKSRFIEHLGNDGESSHGEVAPPIPDHEPEVDIFQSSSDRSDDNHVTNMAMPPGSVLEASDDSSISPELENNPPMSEGLSGSDISQGPPTTNTDPSNVTRSDLEDRLVLWETFLACQIPLPSHQHSDRSSYSESQSDVDSNDENGEQSWFSGIIDDLDASELQDNEDTSQAPTYLSSGDISPLILPSPIAGSSSLDLPMTSSETLQPVEEVQEAAETLDEALSIAQEEIAQEEEEWQEVYLSNPQEGSQDPNATYVPEVVVRALNPPGRPLPGPLEASRELPRRRASLLSTEIQPWEVKEET
jgi:hypothetical protein